MGGVGSGGKRPRAGRPALSAEARELGNNASHRGRVLSHPGFVTPETPEVFDEFDAPDDLTLEERLVWLELAPHAFKSGTLVRATAYDFKVLCRCVLLERQFAQSVAEKGCTKHIAAMKEVSKGLLAYGLRANGRPMASAQRVEAPANPLERFLNRKRG